MSPNPAPIHLRSALMSAGRDRRLLEHEITLDSKPSLPAPRDMVFELRNAQATYSRCASAPIPPSHLQRYVTWTPERPGSTSALGNALNCFASVFLYAIVSGRQIVAGPGRVPSLLCNPLMGGAFECGVPWYRELGELYSEVDELYKRLPRSVCWDSASSTSHSN